MSELEKLELERVKWAINYFGWTAEDLGFKVQTNELDDLEELNDGHIFTSIMNNSKQHKGHYIGVIEGDAVLEDHGFQVRSKPRVYISSNTPVKVGDKFKLFKIK